jgi:hypothetical protein
LAPRFSDSRGAKVKAQKMNGRPSDSSAAP